MGYVVPSVLVYQQLANAGAVANVTPDLDAVIIGPCYNVLEYDGTSTSALTLTAGKTGDGDTLSITNSGVNNVVFLPGQMPGQDVEEASVEVYLNNAKVETMSTKFSGTAGSDRIEVLAASGSGSVTANSAVVTGVTNLSNFDEGDVVAISGAGASAGVLAATVLSIDEVTGTMTLDTAALSSSPSATITKSPFTNVNPLTSTRHAEPGDEVLVTYKAGGSTKVFSTTIAQVESLAGVLLAFVMTDILPADVQGVLLVSVRKTFNNQLLLKTINGRTNYNDSTVGTEGKITILPYPKLAYGTVLASDVHIAYRALRKDLSGAIVDVENASDLIGKLGAPSERNPLALGVQIALANTTGRILAAAIPSEDLAGYQIALDLVEGRRVYSVVPLTQDVNVVGLVKQHVEQMSTPEEAQWRVAVVNTAIPTVQTLGFWSASNVNANSGNNTITLAGGKYVLTSSNSTFVSDGVVPGDTVHVTSGSGSPSPVGSVKVLQVLNNQQLQISAAGTATGVSFYVTRTLTKSQQAAAVAATSTSLGSNRVMHVPQSAGVTVDGVTKYLPGYYLCAAIGGLISGLPVQQSLTNVGLAGIADVQYGNFYFTRAQMSTMAAAGSCLIVQESQGSIPYVRHSLTTDMSVLYLREIQQVKNWDYLSYFFYDILKAFVGRYNITPDTLRILGQTITAGGRLLQGKKLPKLGAPLLDFSIKSLKQDAANKDTVIVELPVQMPTVMNYLNLYLIV